MFSSIDRHYNYTSPNVKTPFQPQKASCLSMKKSKIVNKNPKIKMRNVTLKNLHSFI